METLPEQVDWLWFLVAAVESPYRIIVSSQRQERDGGPMRSEGSLTVSSPNASKPAPGWNKDLRRCELIEADASNNSVFNTEVLIGT